MTDPKPTWPVPLSNPRSVHDITSAARAGFQAVIEGRLTDAMDIAARLDEVSAVSPAEPVHDSSWFAARLGSKAINDMIYLRTKTRDEADRAAVDAYGRGFSAAMEAIGGKGGAA